MAVRNKGDTLSPPDSQLGPPQSFLLPHSTEDPALGMSLPVVSLVKLTSQLSLETMNDSSSKGLSGLVMSVNAYGPRKITLKLILSLLCVCFFVCFWK